jgi:cell division protein FtsI (penicillin-binding protein 3)
MIRSRRIGIAHSVLALFAIAILVKAAQVQLVHGEEWAAIADRQQLAARTVPAPRGEILDATHRVLAQSREMVRLEIAPREVNEPKKLRAALAKLDVDRRLIDRVTNPKSKYTVIPGRFVQTDATPAIALKGVYSFASVLRSYAVSEGARGILGHVDANNKAIDGLELSLDSILKGTAGSKMIIRDSHGMSRESPIEPGVAPTQGNDVVLTINADLQEIAEKALADAVVKMGAEGGDIVILDPHSGDILAMASRRLDPRQTSATVLTEPFEPGSTAKPFMAAALLERRRVKDSDSIDTGDGVLVVEGRKNPIRDDHKIGKANLAEVLRWSSNIGIIKFSERLSHAEKYETLRDFGFGTPTGLPFPTESGGSLYPPKVWSTQSALQVAMGYEIAVTPLQLAAAYAPFANGGELVEPALVKEIIAPDGKVVYEHHRRVVRRVMSRPVADKVRHMLLDVVDEGTALQAALDNYLLAGKTGTPRATVRGRYVGGRYNPNFVSLFPGDNPQYVVVVKMTAPQSSIFAAQTAAPDTKSILEAAVAARNAALDRVKLASSVLPTKRDSIRQSGEARAPGLDVADSRATETLAPLPDTADGRGSVPYVYTLPSGPEVSLPRTMRPVPDVRGLMLRDAVRSLHKAGFRVQLAKGTGGETATNPAAGALASPGTLVRLFFDPIDAR